MCGGKTTDGRRLSGVYNFGTDDEDCVTTGIIAGLFCGAALEYPGSGGKDREISKPKTDTEQANVSP
jgi:hypothetical protein